MRILSQAAVGQGTIDGEEAGMRRDAYPRT